MPFAAFAANWPMHDEPEEELRFQSGMSLKTREKECGIPRVNDDRHAE